MCFLCVVCCCCCFLLGDKGRCVRQRQLRQWRSAAWNSPNSFLLLDIQLIRARRPCRCGNGDNQKWTRTAWSEEETAPFFARRLMSRTRNEKWPHYYDDVKKRASGAAAAPRRSFLFFSKHIQNWQDLYGPACVLSVLLARRRWTSTECVSRILSLTHHRAPCGPAYLCIAHCSWCDRDSYRWISDS